MLDFGLKSKSASKAKVDPDSRRLRSIPSPPPELGRAHCARGVSDHGLKCTGGLASTRTPTHVMKPWVDASYRPPPPASSLSRSPPELPVTVAGDSLPRRSQSRTPTRARLRGSPDSQSFASPVLWAKPDGTVWKSPRTPECYGVAGCREETPIRIRYPELLASLGFRPQH